MLNQEEEARFAELRNHCRELKVPAPMDIFIGLEVRDHDGIVTFDDIQRGHSWVRNWYNSLMFSLSAFTNNQSSFGAGYASIKKTGATVTGDVISNQMMVLGANNNSVYGIVVGTGATAFSAEHYILAAQITSGIGTGQLSYQAQPATTATYDNTEGAEKWTCTQARVFNNNSGASITVKETGIIIYNGNNAFLAERSVLDPTVTVPNGAQLTVTYNFSMDFSAID